ncbi:hypothetical protein QN379_12855 [Glaciimonas sp. Gout2]|uniref:hypothetical protein n=1 Tax=unclassified Glaciimonas TaxID=2644401 RepID=UPI002AB32E61|nr:MULTISPECIES: hypothetical protein [unclassified Glaciimonas]MDY7547727.1 hypothetical protein [Glaciimonas sp. CA11.2]MEB0012948.1 hypothetical protein [Glaciimonas sp. Cout2]MEB0082904.1 hypothetical protein [Glaciimonas sp. Gout2]
MRKHAEIAVCPMQRYNDIIAKDFIATPQVLFPERDELSLYMADDQAWVRS